MGRGDKDREESGGETMEEVRENTLSVCFSNLSHLPKGVGEHWG